ncbi:hypothetical protein SePPVgORF104 [Seal parapoxvirus]|uniref:Uncharacterized protein n=1 Tax=Seal parapoxvirus TaxID=187984 RepID=A0A1Z3GCP5_9POXV|nr:hypothetical protein CGV03_gp104 [Seal parapoxvirus]ASC55534.1 hypothetical protein SePPVgORF104 [Seal parapoxvirus]
MACLLEFLSSLFCRHRARFGPDDVYGSADFLDQEEPKYGAGTPAARKYDSLRLNRQRMSKTRQPEEDECFCNTASASASVTVTVTSVSVSSSSSSSLCGNCVSVTSVTMSSSSSFSSLPSV